MKLRDLLSNEQFLSRGAYLYQTARGERWLVVTPFSRPVVERDVTRAVRLLTRRGLLSVDWLRGQKADAVGKRVACAKLAKGYHFLITPSCHGNGGWCGSTTHRADTREALLKLNPSALGIAGDGDFGDDRARICRVNDVNKSVLIWDREDQVWNKR
jgi:hypothetical protein